MDLFLGEESITLNFGREPNRHCLFIDVKEDRLYLDGSRLLTTKKEFNYNKGLMFQKNAIRKKVRIKTVTFDGKVLGIDICPDGRVFFKFFIVCTPTNQNPNARNCAIHPVAKIMPIGLAPWICRVRWPCGLRV